MNTITGKVYFYGEEVDDFGMPLQYHAYVVIGRDAKPEEAPQGHGIAKVYPISREAPPLQPDHVVGNNCRSAVLRAIMQLRKIHAHLKIESHLS